MPMERVNCTSASYRLAALLALITLVVYLPTLRNEFVNLDDEIYVYGNAYIRSLDPSFLAWAFTDLSAGFWHPLTWISYAIDYAIWGLNPLGYHLTALLLHAGNTFLVVSLVVRLLYSVHNPVTGGGSVSGSSAFPDRRDIWLAAGVTGLLFGLHPLHVESVAWVSERKDLLCALFFLLSVLTYLNYSQQTTATWYLNRQYILSFAFFVLALSSKTMAVTLPVVLLLLDWYPLRRFACRGTATTLFMEKIPFVTAALVISIVSIVAQKATGALESRESISSGVRILVAFKALLMYLWKMMYPVHLIPFYPYPHNVTFFSTEYLAAIVVVSGVTAYSLAIVRKRKLLLAIWGYYVITLLPVLGIVRIGSFYMADRFTYLPSVGPFLLLGLGAAVVWGRVVSSLWRQCLVVLAMTLVVAFSFLTVKQTLFWKDSVSLFTHTLDVCHDNWVAHNNLGSYYLKTGDITKASYYIKESIRCNQNNPDAYMNLGVINNNLGNHSQAIYCFKKALEIQDDLVMAHLNLGLALILVGDREAATEEYRIMQRLNPGQADVLLNVLTQTSATTR